MKNLSKLIEIEDIRSIWKHEQGDFSPWLAKEENLNILSEEIGIYLSNPILEQNVGSFALDIQTETEDGKIAIIENQLELTNHDHLGKIITYASGLEAEYIIWIVKKAREEHRKAVDWLNNVTNEDVNFFLLEIKLYTIGDSQPAPKFELISEPNNWSKLIKSSSKKELKKYHLTRLEFWEKFIESNDLWSNRTPPKSHWFNAFIGNSNYYISFCTSKQNPKGASVEFNCKQDTDYAMLQTEKDNIEKEFDIKLTWNDKSSGGQVYVQFDYSINDEDKWSEIFSFYLEYYNKFKDIFPKYLS